MDDKTINPSSDASFSRNGANATIGDDSTLLVQGGAAYAIISFPVDFNEVLAVLEDENVTADVAAILCLEHEPSNRDGNENVTYSVCQLLVPQELADSDVESWTSDKEFFMPGDCVGGTTIDFEVSPASTSICFDVTDILILSNDPLETPSLSELNRMLQLEAVNVTSDIVKDVLFMIDNMDASDTSAGPSDRFYSREDGEGREPELAIVTMPIEEVAEDEVLETPAPTTANDTESLSPTVAIADNTTSPTESPVAPISNPQTSPPSGGGCARKAILIPLLVLSLWM
jgi:hypothetical protein